MSGNFLSLLTTPSVRQAQQHYYGASRPVAEKNEAEALTDSEIGFIEGRDSFYLGTVNETGWPYLQHRGGNPGFIKVLTPRQLAFADYKGNRQLISTGNIVAGGRVALFFMDYPERMRLKILGHARIEDARGNPELVRQLAEPGQIEKVERLFFIEVVAFDWNCSQYITPRYTLAEVEEIARPLQQQVAELTAKLEAQQKKI